MLGDAVNMVAKVLAGMFMLEDLVKAYAQHIRESIMRVLCDELKDLLEGVM